MSKNNYLQGSFLAPEQEQQLREVLGQYLSPPGLNVPKECDDAILAMIDQKSQEINRNNKKEIFYYFAAAALFLVMIGTGLLIYLPRSVPKPNGGGKNIVQVPPALEHRTNDIVDVYLIALRIEQGQKQDDVNGDGLVDKEDVREMAEKVVSVSTEKGV